MHFMIFLIKSCRFWQIASPHVSAMQSVVWLLRWVHNSNQLQPLDKVEHFVVWWINWTISKILVLTPSGSRLFLKVRFIESMTVLFPFGSDDTKAMVKIDFRNAFNAVSRDCIFEAVKNHFPALLPWVHFCYSGLPFLFAGDSTLHSGCGVQQGDP